MRKFTEAEVTRIFDEALTLPCEERERYIEHVCRGQDALRQEIASLLTAHNRAGRFLNQPVLQEQPEITQFADPLLGRSIGPYVIEQRIGSGGMGDVYLGRRNDQTFDISVAIKIIRRGLLSEESIRRFTLERQLLANLTHPNIARLLDGGTTPDGQPYLVMEYIQGERLDHWCDARCLSVDARLRLFLQVCDAVQEAHRHLVVHRDLKPGNILVTDEGVVKLLDFGLARLLSPDAQPTGDATQTIERRLTPAYASPEQIRGETVTTAGDVYSLGVVLYELLTGRSPYAVSTTDTRSLERAICDDEPTRPSATVAGRSPEVEEISRRRSIVPSRLRRILKGDLGTIVMTALRKEPERRYASVQQLAEDIRNEHRSLPIIARPDTLGYRAQRFVQRNRLAVLGAAAMLLVLIGSTVVSFSFALREAAAREREREQRLAAQVERDRAVEAEHEAARRADELEIVSDFQARQFSDLDLEWMGSQLRKQLFAERTYTLDLIEPDIKQRSDAVRELDRALANVNFTNLARRSLQDTIFRRALLTVDEQFADQPEIRARLLQRIAGTMNHLGMLEDAIEPQVEVVALKRRLYGDDDPRTLRAIAQYGSLRLRQNRFTDAEDAARSSLAGMRRVLGDAHPDTLSAATGLARALRMQGAREEAEGILREALETATVALDEDHMTTPWIRNELGYVLFLQGRYAEAEQLLREADAAYQLVSAETAPQGLGVLRNLSRVLRAKGRTDESLEMTRRLMTKLRRSLGDDHLQTILAEVDLGETLAWSRQFDEAEPLLHAALDKSQRVLGENHTITKTALLALGYITARQRRHEEAEQFFRRAMDISRRIAGPAHPDTLFAAYSLAITLNRLGRNEEGRDLMREAVQRQRVDLDPTDPRLLRCIRTLARCLRDLGELAEAEDLFREAYEGYHAFYGPTHLQSMISLNDYCEVLLLQEKHFDAAELLPALIDVRRQIRGEFHPQTIRAHFQLVATLNQLTRFDEAYDRAREVLAVIAAETDTEDPRRGEAKRLLAETLFGLHRFDEAATSGVMAYTILAQSLGETHARCADTAALLAMVYDAWHLADPKHRHNDQAEYWRERSKRVASEQ
ncbi:MAG: serine/threonine protein kinase [Phycisphaerales bacterium]|nr:MAG: serine/threonine protein kinase [Phycisphaerales bacterium]